MSESVDLVIDTKEVKSSNGFFTFPVSQGFALNTKSVQLIDVILPQTMYIVQTGVNDSFDYKIGAGPTTTFTIPAGAYTTTTLLNALQTATTLTFALNTDTLKVTISTGGSAFALLFGTGPNVAKSCASLLGFAAADVGPTMSTTGGFAALMYGPFSLLLRIQELGILNVLTSTGQGGTFSVPVAAASGTVLRLDQNKLNQQIVTMPSLMRFNQFNFQLVYTNGSVVNLNGASYQITLRVKSENGAVLI